MPQKPKRLWTNYCPKHFLLSIQCKEKNCPHAVQFKQFPISGNMALAKVYRELPTFSPYRQNIRDNIDEVLHNSSSDNLSEAYDDIIRYAEEQVQKYLAEGGKTKKRKTPSKKDSKVSPKRRKVDSSMSDTDSDSNSNFEEDGDEPAEPILYDENEIPSPAPRTRRKLRRAELPESEYPRISVETSVPEPPNLQDHIQNMYTNRVQIIHIRWVMNAHRTGIISDSESEYLQMLVYNDRCPLSTVTLFLSLHECLTKGDTEQAKRQWQLEGSVLLAEILDMLARKTSPTRPAVSTDKKVMLSIESMAAEGKEALPKSCE